MASIDEQWEAARVENAIRTNWWAWKHWETVAEAQAIEDAAQAIEDDWIFYFDSDDDDFEKRLENWAILLGVPVTGKK